MTNDDSGLVAWVDGILERRFFIPTLIDALETSKFYSAEWAECD